MIFGLSDRRKVDYLRMSIGAEYQCLEPSERVVTTEFTLTDDFAP